MTQTRYCSNIAEMLGAFSGRERHVPLHAARLLRRRSRGRFGLATDTSLNGSAGGTARRASNRIRSKQAKELMVCGSGLHLSQLVVVSVRAEGSMAEVRARSKARQLRARWVITRRPHTSNTRIEGDNRRREICRTGRGVQHDLT
jgi:hypothetical protein